MNRAWSRSNANITSKWLIVLYLNAVIELITRTLWYVIVPFTTVKVQLATEMCVNRFSSSIYVRYSTTACVVCVCILDNVCQLSYAMNKRKSRCSRALGGHFVFNRGHFGMALSSSIIKCEREGVINKRRIRMHWEKEKKEKMYMVEARSKL